MKETRHRGKDNPSSNLHSPSSLVGCEPWEFDGEKWRPKSQGERRQIRSHRDLDVYNLAYTLALWNTNYSVGLALFSNYSTGLAMEVFRLTARFPKEERYGLVDQMRRSSRNVCGNITEGFAKRRYQKVFKNSLNDSLGESEETRTWLDFSLDCNYIEPEEHKMLTIGYEQVGAMLWTLMTKWQSFQ